MTAIKKFVKPFLGLLGVYLVVSAILRVILLFNPIVSGHFSFGMIFQIFFMGALSNALVFCQAAVFLWLYLIFLSDKKYQKPYGHIIFGCWLALFVYITFFNTVLNQYGSVVPLLGQLFVGWSLVSFGAMLFLPKYRHKIRLGIYSYWIFLFVGLILLNAVSEYYFFNEFGVRYNFIAVDYLIYTNEVIGNMMESYPVVPLFSVLGICALVITWFLVRKTKGFLPDLPSMLQKLMIIVGIIASVLMGWLTIPMLGKMKNSSNKFANELQDDGLYKFYDAYTSNKLNYFQFYPTLPEEKVFGRLHGEIPGSAGKSTRRVITDSLKELHKNVVLITIESMSASFMQHYGNQKNITPFLDSLADKSLFFTNFYAAGNRTVRGLEALTLSLPPSPGESVIRRNNNNHKFNIGSIFKKRGYSTKFMYGGFSSFDNMYDFFTGNGYDVVDRSQLSDNEITFANIWGVCDEDMGRKAIQVMNREASKGTPFFDHWMTISNHRPYTYPKGKIDISPEKQIREGGVKYSDYALSVFFKLAQKQPWFKNTVFVILADHCASSAGRTSLPMNKYRIPALVYSPGFIKPQKVSTLMSQIDLMPTVLGLLHFSYTSKFYGMNVFSPDYTPRAFIATYQDLGYIKDSTLTILSPVRQIRQYRLKLQPKPGIAPEFQEHYREIPMQTKNQNLIDQAVSYYQSASWLLKNKGFSE